MIYKTLKGFDTTLEIIYDEDVTNPRDDENLSSMMCWHRNYNLGDKHDYKTSKDFLRELVRQSVSPKKVISFVKKGKASNIKLEYNRSDKYWYMHIWSEYSKTWNQDDYQFDMKNEEDVLIDSLTEVMTSSDLLSLAEEKNIIMPLYLYDHSGITMKTSPFSCPWDSGQVGYIYVSHESVKKEYGKVTKKNLEKAKNLIESEVKLFDDYITGDVYYFNLRDKDGEIIDSVGGFYGSDFKDNGMVDYTPDEFHDLL